MQKDQQTKKKLFWSHAVSARLLSCVVPNREFDQRGSRAPSCDCLSLALSLFPFSLSLALSVCPSFSHTHPGSMCSLWLPDYSAVSSQNPAQPFLPALDCCLAILCVHSLIAATRWPPCCAVPPANKPLPLPLKTSCCNSAAWPYLCQLLQAQKQRLHNSWFN